MQTNGLIVQGNKYRFTYSAWFDDPRALERQAGRIIHANVYITINPVSPDLLARADYLIRAEATTTDSDIVALRHLFIDLDARRPAGISSTESERAAALERRDRVLAEDPVLAAASCWGCSGNGGWILALLPDYPNDDEHKALIKAATASLRARYNDAAVEIDPRTINPSRIMALCGTIKAKGVHRPERPWRPVTFDGSAPTRVPLDLKAWLAEHSPQGPSRTAVAVPAAPGATTRAEPTRPAPQPQQPPPGPREKALKRADAYIFSEKFPDSIEGQDGHGRLYHVACILVDGFGLTREEALPIFSKWNQAKARPPEDDKQVQHKLDDAIKNHPTPSLKLLQAPRPGRGGGAPRPDEPESGGAGSADDDGDESQVEILLRLADCLELVHDADQVAYALVPYDGHTETYPLRSRWFRLWLVRSFYLAQREAPYPEALTIALNVLEARALFDGATEPVPVRVGGGPRGDDPDDLVVHVDLCNSRWQVVEVDRGGWRVVDTSPVRFRRARGMLALPMPERGGGLDRLRRFVNVSDADHRLILAWVTQALLPEGPYPVLLVRGEQGSAKSTTSGVLRRLVDPHSTLLRSPPRDVRDLMIAATNSWVVGYDNLSGLPDWLSDALCRLATGGGFGTRTLYENNEETFFYAKRPVILNGIDEFVHRNDLLDRCLVLELPLIPGAKRREERAFWRQFEAALPGILGALFDAVAGGCDGR
jgi:hypothetical protein